MTAFKSFEVHITAVITINGADYFPVDWDGDESAFRSDMTKEAVEGLRHAELNIGDAWVDHIEEVTA